MRFIAFIFAAVLFLVGAYLTIGGGYLLALGGSFYYLAYGLLLVVCAWLFQTKRRASTLLLCLGALFTLGWGVWEAGLDYWALFPRLLMPFGLAVAGLFVYALTGGAAQRSSRKFAFASGCIGLVLCLGGFARGFVPVPVIPAKDGPFENAPPQNAPSDWTAYGRTDEGTRYAPFTQINPTTVKDLQLAWSVHTGDRGPGVRQDTPLQIGNVVYTCTPNDLTLAYDADTGRKIWSFNAHAKSAIPWQRCRGLAYYAVPETPAPAASETVAPAPVSAPQSTEAASSTSVSSSPAATTPDQNAAAQPAAATTPAPQVCRQRIFNTTIDARLIALDAKTGVPCSDFGENGVVALDQGMGETPSGFYFQTSAPTVARGRIIIGGWVVDNQMRGEPSGVIRAFDAVTGKLVWAWDMGHPDWHGLPPEGEHYTRGTPNMWSTAAYDDKLGLVYVPLGNDTPDYNTINRKPIAHKYNSSVVALDIETGVPRWKFQTVHHDVWDYDLPSQPALVDAPDKTGKFVPALLQTTKRGQLFLLDRATGEPLADVVEKPVSISNAVPEEKNLSTHQPYSVGMPTIGDLPVTENHMWGVTTLDQLLCRIQFHKVRYTGDFTPAGLHPSIEQPGNIGGMNWGSVSYDPLNHLAMLSDIRVPSLFYQVPRKEYPQIIKEFPNASRDAGHGPSPELGTPYGIVTVLWLSPLGVPCIQPPYGTISAVDLKTHKIAWQIPSGTAAKLGPFGITSHMPLTMGMPAYAGTMTTAGGLVFHASSQDYKIRAYDEKTGKQLWAYQMPLGSSATPMSYVSPATGKQYILVSVGGMIHNGPQGDLLMAFSLPGSQPNAEEKNAQNASDSATDAAKTDNGKAAAEKAE